MNTSARLRQATLGLAVALACLGAGCAYTVRSGALPAHLRTVAIPVFENSTTEYALEQDLTNAVIDRFIRDNSLKVVDERSASAVLRGKIIEYRNSVFGFSEQNRAQEYRVSITVQVSFKDVVKNRELWSEAALQKTANYYVQPVGGDSARTEADGRRTAVGKIADEVLARTVQGW